MFIFKRGKFHNSVQLSIFEYSVCSVVKFKFDSLSYLYNRLLLNLHLPHSWIPFSIKLTTKGRNISFSHWLFFRVFFIYKSKETIFFSKLILRALSIFFFKNFTPKPEVFRIITSFHWKKNSDKGLQAINVRHKMFLDNK